jgi:Mrp family chromosome partitioning ATPase
MEIFDSRPASVGDAPERFALARTPIDRLYVLPAGPRPPDPDDALTSARVSTILHLLRRHFQAIVVDSPPAALVSDSNTLAPQVDGIVYVVRYGGFPRKLIQTTLERIRGNGGKVLGVALNAVNLRRESYADDHYYYSEYYRRSPDA